VESTPLTKSTIPAASAQTGPRPTAAEQKLAAQTNAEPDDGLNAARLAAESVTTLKYRPISGALLQGEAGRTTTVLGNYRSDIRHILAETGDVKSLDFGAKPGGLNVLNVPDHLYQSPTQFWNQYNKPWLDAALGRGDKIIFATKPDWSNLTRVNAAGKLELSGFGKEYLHLRKNGLPSQLP